MTLFKSIGWLILVFCLLPGCSQQAPEHRLVAADGERIAIRLAGVNDGGVYFFTYPFAGKNINFFVRTDGTGKLQAHFDACYSCFKYKLGYVREDSQVVCIACRIGYELDDVIWDYIGACAPINLKSKIADRHLVIQRTRLEKGKRFF